MNSFASGGYEGYNNTDVHRGNANSRDQMKLPDRLTRDFLGVGQIVRSMSGGISPTTLTDQHQQQHGGFMNLASLEAHRNNNNNAAPPSGHSFGGAANFQ